MAKDFNEYVKERQKDWTPDVWAVYNVASAVFRADAQLLQQNLTAEQEEGTR